MAKKKSKNHYGQWLLIALAAFALYQGLKHYLNPIKISEKKTLAAKILREIPQHSPLPTAPLPEIKEPVKKWTFETAGRFLPEKAYPDNYNSIPTEGESSALLAYAQLIEGKTPGPQGLTNTRPGLRWVKWDGKKYEAEDLDFSKLENAGTGLALQKFTGLPQIPKKPLSEDGSKIFPVKLFLDQDTRVVVAYLIVDGKNAGWAKLNNAEGKELPAAFLQGTTKSTTREIRTEKHDGKLYLIVNSGKLNELKLYEGYQWKVEAFGWNGQAFVFDKNYSEKLTKEKK